MNIIHKLSKYHVMEMPSLKATISTKQASCARHRLGLMDSDDEEDMKTDLEIEYTLYISEKWASSEMDILLYWQVCDTPFCSIDQIPITLVIP